MTENGGRIDQFIDEYFFLSNFYEVPVKYDGILYLNSEAAFQAQKAEEYETRKEYSNLDPNCAKRKGIKEKLRKDWEQVKDRLMKEIVIAKFEQHPDLKAKLLATGNRELVEGTTWNDTYWGINIHTGEGKNQLGKTLMEIREEFRK